MDPITLLTGAAVGFLAESLRHYIVRRRRITRAERRSPRYLTPQNLHRHKPVIRPPEDWPNDKTFRGNLRRESKRRD